MNKTELLGKLSQTPRGAFSLPGRWTSWSYAAPETSPLTQFLSLTEQAAAGSSSPLPATRTSSGAASGTRAAVPVFSPRIGCLPRTGGWMRTVPSAVHIACPPGCGLTTGTIWAPFWAWVSPGKRWGICWWGRRAVRPFCSGSWSTCSSPSAGSGGRQRVRVSPLAPADLTPPVRQVKQIRDTVATLGAGRGGRLPAFSISRSKMADLISSKKADAQWEGVRQAGPSGGRGGRTRLPGAGQMRAQHDIRSLQKGRIMIVIERYI